MALQSAPLDYPGLAQPQSVDKGPWTLGRRLVHGFGKINSSRDTVRHAGGTKGNIRALTADWYLRTIGQGPHVPKAALEYVRARRDSSRKSAVSIR